MGGADRTQCFRTGEDLTDRGEELVGEFLTPLGQEAREVVAFEMLPEPFDGVEVRAVGRQELRLDVVLAQALRLVPAGVIKNQDDAFLRLRRNLLRHRVEERLEDLRIVVGTMRLTSWPLRGLTAPTTFWRMWPP